MPVLFGPEAEVRRSRNRGRPRYRQVPDRVHGRSRGVGLKAAMAAGAGEVAALMKGSLHTDVFCTRSCRRKRNCAPGG